jgi:hypothetical protein
MGHNNLRRLVKSVLRLRAPARVAHEAAVRVAIDTADVAESMRYLQSYREENDSGEQCDAHLESGFLSQLEDLVADLVAVIEYFHFVLGRLGYMPSRAATRERTSSSPTNTIFRQAVPGSKTKSSVISTTEGASTDATSEAVAVVVAAATEVVVDETATEDVSLGGVALDLRARFFVVWLGESCILLAFAASAVSSASAPCSETNLTTRSGTGRSLAASIASDLRFVGIVGGKAKRRSQS